VKKPSPPPQKRQRRKERAAAVAARGDVDGETEPLLMGMEEEGGVTKHFQYYGIPLESPSDYYYFLMQPSTSTSASGFHVQHSLAAKLLAMERGAGSCGRGRRKARRRKCTVFKKGHFQKITPS